MATVPQRHRLLHHQSRADRRPDTALRRLVRRRYPWSSIYGGRLRLASDARRFNVSPAWHAWVAAAPAVRLLAQVGTQSLHRHALGLANRFRAGIGLEPGDSAIVSLATDGAAADAMAAARIKGSARAGRLRLSFHVSTSDQDADLLRRHVISSHPAAL